MFIQQRPVRSELIPQPTTAGERTVCFVSVWFCSVNDAAEYSINVNISDKARSEYYATSAEFH